MEKGTLLKNINCKLETERGVLVYANNQIGYKKS